MTDGSIAPARWAGRLRERLCHGGEEAMRSHIATAVVTAALALTTLTGLGAGGTAEALVPAITFVSNTSPKNSMSPKMVEAVCPPGMSALGGGAVLSGAQGDVLVQGAFPMFDAGLGRHVFVVKATETLGGTLASWTVTANAYCTPTTVPTYIVEDTVFDSNPIKSVAAHCPEGMKVVGMGGEVSTAFDLPPGPLVGTIPNAGVVFHGMTADDDLLSVTARATEVDGTLGGSFAGNWRVIAVAACAQQIHFDGLELRYNTESAGGLVIGDAESHVYIGCSAKGLQMISVATAIHDDDMGQWYIDRFNRYNAYQDRSYGDAYRNNGLTSVDQTVSIICIKK
jgi:hypothetical protein